METEDLRFPIGRFNWKDLSDEDPDSDIFELEQLPNKLRRALYNLSDEQLDTPYREEGWTIRQVAHHLPDSHMNAYIRFKLGLTEESPKVKTYEEKLWAELPDSQSSVDVSLDLLDALHYRWVVLLRSMNEAQFARTVTHPDHGKITLRKLLALYTWHGNHHLTHITNALTNRGWA